MEGRDLDYVKERLESIQETEQRLVSFLSSFSKLVDKIHDTHVEMTINDQDKKKSQDFDEFDETDDNNDSKDNNVKELINKCYDDLSFSSIHLRRELKLLELKLPLPPNLSKKASDINNEKLKQLINDI